MIYFLIMHFFRFTTVELKNEKKNNYKGFFLNKKDSMKAFKVSLLWYNARKT